MALAGFAGWIRSIGLRCTGLDGRLKTLEKVVIEKSNLISIHETNLSAGEKQMDEMKTQLDMLNSGINKLHLQGVETVSKIDSLATKIHTEISEVFLKFEPRLKRTEEQIKILEDSC